MTTYDGNEHAAIAIVTGSVGFVSRIINQKWNGTGYDTPRGDAPVDTGRYLITSHYVVDSTHSASSDIATLVIIKAFSTTTTTGDGPFTYDGTEHFGGSGNPIKE